MTKSATEDRAGGATLAEPVAENASELDLDAQLDRSFAASFGDSSTGPRAGGPQRTTGPGAPGFTVGSHLTPTGDPKAADGRTSLAQSLAQRDDPADSSPSQNYDPLVPADQTPLTPDELWRLAQDLRGFESTSSGPGDDYRSKPATLPAGALRLDEAGNPVERGARLGKGYETVASIQVLDAAGRQVAVARGIFYSGGPQEHAEQVAIKRLGPHVPDRVEGGTLVVVGDQKICEHCRAALIAYAQQRGIAVIDPHEPTRAKQRGSGNTTAKTASATSTQAGRPPLRVEQQPAIKVPQATPATPTPTSVDTRPTAAIPGATTSAGPLPTQAAPGAVTTPIDTRKRTATASSYTTENKVGTRTVTAGQTSESTQAKTTSIAAKDGALTASRSTTRKRTAIADQTTDSSRTRTTSITAKDGALTASRSTTRQRTVTDTDSGDKVKSQSTTRTSAVGTTGLTSTNEAKTQLGDQTNTKTSSSGISRGEGRIGYSGSRSTTTGAVDAEGKLTSGSTTKETTDLGLVAGPGEAGVGGTYGTSSTTTHRKGVTTGTSSTLGGKVVATCTEVAGSDPPRYRVGITIDLAFGVSGNTGSEREAELQKQSGRSGKLTLSAQWGQTASFTHELSEAETIAYLGALRNHKEDGPHRELAVVRLAAAGALDEARALLTKLKTISGSAGAARELREGDSAEDKHSFGLGTELDSSGTSRGGAKASFKLGFSKTGSIGRTVSRKGGKIVIRLEVLGKSSTSVGGTLGYGIGSMSLGGDRASSTGEVAVFVLDLADPEFTARYAALMAPGTLQEVRTAAAVHSALLTSSTISSGEESNSKVGFGLAGVGLEFNQGGSTTESVTTDALGTTRELSGTHTSGITAKAPFGPTITAKQLESFTAKTRPDGGTTAEASTTKSETDLGASMTELTTAPITTLTGALTGKTSLLKESRETFGTAVDDDDYARLSRLAVDPAAWTQSFLNGSGLVNDGLQEWQATRLRVLAAAGDREEISRALVAFQKNGQRRNEVIQAAYRKAGGGIRFDFPKALERHSAAYAELVIASPVAEIKKLSSVGLFEEAQARASATLHRLATLQGAIIAKQSEVSDAGVLAEMLQRIGVRIQEVNGVLRALRAATTPVPELATSSTPAPNRSEAVEQLETPVGPTSSTVALEPGPSAKDEAAVTIHSISATLASLQARERALMAFIDSEYGRTFRRPNVYDILEKLQALREMYVPWRAELERLRQAFVAHGDPASTAEIYAPNQARYEAQYRRFIDWGAR